MDLTNAFVYLDEVQREFQKNSDRGVAVVAASFLDEILKELLQSFFARDAKSDKEIFEANGPLSTFSAKISICHRLGLISQFEYRAINTIRSIRNDFAHQLGEVSFQQQSIKDRCRNIRVPDGVFNPSIIPLPTTSGEIRSLRIERADIDSPRELFQETVIQLVHMLAGRTVEAMISARSQPKDYTKATEPMQRMVDYYQQQKRKYDELRAKLNARGEAVTELADERQMDLAIRLAQYSIALIDAAQNE